MSKQHFYGAVCISAIIHAVLFGAIYYVVHLKPEPALEGGGKERPFAVSIIEEGFGRQATRPFQKQRPESHTPSEMIQTDRSKSSTAQSSEGLVASVVEEPAAGTPEAGGGQGEYLGPGNGKGDKVLSIIWRKINLAKYYPLHARRNSWEGNPRITFKIGSEGQIEYVHLAKSCGITELDNAAVETVRRAAPLPQYPRPITLTIRYSLRE